MAFNKCYVGNVSTSSLTPGAWELAGEFRTNGLVLAVAFTLFLLAGATLNLTVIVSVLRKRLYSQPTFILLLNLSAIDTLFCVLVMPFHMMVGYAGEFVLGSSDWVRCATCKIGVIVPILSFLSLYSVALMSVDRLVYIKRPLRYNDIVTLKRTALAITLTWLLCTAASLPPLFGFGEINFLPSVATCTLDLHSNAYYILLMVGVALLPLLLLVVASLWVVRIAYRQLRETYDTQSSLSGSSVLKEAYLENVCKRAKRKKLRLQFHLVRVFGAIIVANIMTWLPIMLLAVAALFVGKSDIPLWYKTFAYLSFLFQPVLHPILEASLITDIEFPLSKLLTRCLSGCSSQVWQERRHCNVGVVCNGVGCGRIHGEWVCRVCGLLDMCSVATLPHSEDVGTVEELDS